MLGDYLAERLRGEALRRPRDLLLLLARLLLLYRSLESRLERLSRDLDLLRGDDFLRGDRDLFFDLDLDPDFFLGEGDRDLLLEASRFFSDAADDSLDRDFFGLSSSPCLTMLLSISDLVGLTEGLLTLGVPSRSGVVSFGGAAGASASESFWGLKDRCLSFLFFFFFFLSFLCLTCSGEAESRLRYFLSCLAPGPSSSFSESSRSLDFLSSFCFFLSFLLLMCFMVL